jgi:hypothetical protein
VSAGPDARDAGAHPPAEHDPGRRVSVLHRLLLGHGGGGVAHRCGRQRRGPRQTPARRSTRPARPRSRRPRNVDQAGALDAIGPADVDRGPPADEAAVINTAGVSVVGVADAPDTDPAVAPTGAEDAPPADEPWPPRPAITRQRRRGRCRRRSAVCRRHRGSPSRSRRPALRYADPRARSAIASPPSPRPGPTGGSVQRPWHPRTAGSACLAARLTQPTDTLQRGGMLRPKAGRHAATPGGWARVFNSEQPRNDSRHLRYRGRQRSSPSTPARLDEGRDLVHGDALADLADDEAHALQRLHRPHGVLIACGPVVMLGRGSSRFTTHS